MKLVIFDIDGTLLNSVEADDKCFRLAFRDVFHIDLAHLDWEYFKSITSGTDEGMAVEIFRHYFGRTPSLEEMEKFKWYFHKLLNGNFHQYPGSFEEIPGAAEFFRILYEDKDIGVAISTGSWRDSAILKLAALGIKHRGIPLATSDDDEYRTFIIKKAISESQNAYSKTSFESIIYFGDGLWDLKAATEADTKFIGVDYKRKGTFSGKDVKDVIENYKKPENILGKLALM